MIAYLSDIVYGSTFGILTSSAIVATTAGMKLTPTLVLIIGLTILFTMGIALAVSGYLSTPSEERKKNVSGKRPIVVALLTFIGFILMGLIPLFLFVLAMLIKI